MTLRELINQVGEDKLDYQINYLDLTWDNDMEEWERTNLEVDEIDIDNIKKTILLS